MSDALVTPETLDEATSAGLRRHILTLADSKRLMGIRYSDWLLGAPSIEAGIAASSMAQDEWGHARLLYAMLKAFGIDPVAVEHDRPAQEYASMAALDEPMPDWAALIAAIVVADGALSAALSSFAEGAYEPARNRVPKMLAEEEFHVSLGVAWYKRLAEADDEARGLLVRATEAMLPTTLMWVAADDDVSATLSAAGLLGSPGERIGAYRDSLRDLLAMAAVDVDAISPAGAWDASRGRTSGQPDEDSVERARGDKNRALFVE